MRTQILPKAFLFTEADRDDLILSDGTKIQLDSVNNCISLVPNSHDEYPLDTELYVVTRRTSPGAGVWIKWKMLLAGVYHVTDGTTVKTAHRMRLHDGTNHRYWNGATWAVAGAGNWNTETEVNAHIETFNYRTFGVVINLQTTDKQYTPRLEWLTVAWEGRIYFWEDILFRSLVPTMGAGVRPISDYPIKMSAAASSIDLNTYPLDAGFEIVSIDSVFDHEADPNHLTNLYSAYNPTTKVITLTGPVAINHYAFVRFVYSVPVIVNQDQDYLELAKVPAIVIENFREAGSQTVVAREYVTNRATVTGWQFAAPYQTTFAFDIIAHAPGGVDVLRLQEEIVSFFDATPMLTSKGLDDRYRLHLLSEFEDTTTPGEAGVKTIRATALLHDVLSFHKPAVAGAPVSRIRLVGDVAVDIPVT